MLVSTIAAACLIGMSSVASAANLVVYNGDLGTGKGLDDPTAKAPQGGNPGTTLGEQRRIAYEFAADLWGSVLKSKVDIKVGASFQALACTPTGAVLGSAGPNWIDRDFPNAPLSGVWYHSALADSIAKQDLDPYEDDPLDIVSRFNGDIGVRPDCLTGADWYYGLDGKTPAGSINFLNVVMHEIGHGLGFSGFINKTTGAFIFDGISPKPDVYSRWAIASASGRRFDDPSMTDADRALAMRTLEGTVWGGPTVTREAALILDDRPVLKVRGSATGLFNAGTAVFGPAADGDTFNGRIQLADDGAGADPGDACEPLAPGSLTGKIAFINRGGCSFEPKVVNAQNAGATAVIIGNVASSAPGLINMADDPTVEATIPSVLIVVQDADVIRATATGMRATVGTVRGRYVGTDNSSHVQLYSPTVVASGSTFSHFDTAVTPNVLMEPFITTTLNAQNNTDLTAALLKDVGWKLDKSNASIGDCETQVPALETGGITLGANVQAQSNLCESSASRPADYLRCMGNYTRDLRASNALTPRQVVSVNICSVNRTVELVIEDWKSHQTKK